MLLIRDLPDLLKYLQTRRDMCKFSDSYAPKHPSNIHTTGMIYAYEQAIEAVQALIDNDKMTVEITPDDVPVPQK